MAPKKKKADTDNGPDTSDLPDPPDTPGDVAGDAPVPPKGKMALTPAAENPQPGDRVFPARHAPELVDMPHRWLDPDVMVADLEKHITESHGLEPDKQMLRDVVAFIKSTFCQIS